MQHIHPPLLSMECSNFSGCPQHWKFISVIQDVTKHEFRRKESTALNQHSLKDSAVVLRNPFYWRFNVDTSVCLLADENAVKLCLLTNQTVTGDYVYIVM